MRKFLISLLACALTAVSAVGFPALQYYWGSGFDPYATTTLAARYDASVPSSLIVNSSNRVSLWADISGNSAVNVLCLNGAGNNYGSAPNSAALQITGDIDLRAELMAVSWTPSSPAYLVSKWLTTGTGPNSYTLGVLTTGKLELAWSSTGSNTLTADSTVAVGFSAYATGWIRGTLAVSSGTVTFYTSPDGVTWTQLGSTVVSGATSINSNTTAITLGGLNATNSLLVGNLYRAQIYNGINGTLVFDANFATASKLAATFTESSTNAATVTINTSGSQGARISGARDLVQLTTADQPLYLPWSGTNYGYSPAVSGNYFSTPSSTALNITGDIDIRIFASLTNWKPAADQALIAKRQTGTEVSYWMSIDHSDGLVNFLFSSNGSTEVEVQSSVAPTVTNGSAIWLRATRASLTGIVTFYTSTDGVNWTLLGTPQTGATGSLFVSTSILEVGSRNGGGAANLSGNVYQAQVYSGIAGTLAANFQPSQTTNNATSWTASTGEVWTVNQSGATPAQIVGRASVLFDGSAYYAASAGFSYAQPETIYFVGKQITWTTGTWIYDGATAASMSLYRNSTTPDVYVYAGINALFFNSFVLGVNAVVTSVFNGASSMLRYNLNSTITPQNIGAANGNGFTLGSEAGATGFGNFQTNEVLLYSGTQATTTQTETITFLGGKWKTP